MAGESTNPPSGPGPNPGQPTPPVNDQGAARPNPAPAPPQSQTPKPDEKKVEKTEKAVEALGTEAKDSKKALEEFKKKQEELNQSLEKQKKLIKDKEELDKKFKAATEARRVVEQKIATETQALNAQYATQRNKDGVWMAGTEKLQAEYAEKLKAITAQKEESVKAETEATTALDAHKKSIEEAQKANKDALEALKKMRDEIVKTDETLKKDLDPALEQMAAAISGSNKEAENQNKQQIKSFLDDFGTALGLSDVATLARSLGILSKGKEKKAEGEKKEPTIIDTTAGGKEIKKALDDFVAAETDRIKKEKPDAKEEDIAKEIATKIESGDAKKAIQAKIQEEYSKKEQEILKRIESTDKTNTVELEKLQKEMDTWSQESKKVQESITQLNETQLKQFQLAKEAKADAEEADKEKGGGKKEGGKSPLIAFFKEATDKNTGFFKSLLMILTFVVGAYLGYIWKKIQMVIAVLQFLPFGIGSRLGNLFGGIGKGAMGIFAPVMKFIQPILGWMSKLLGFFPGVAGTVAKFSGIFKFAFGVVGKALGPIMLAIDIIMGMIRGFKETGDIKGLILGALAGVVKFFTFGLLDFKKVFDFLGLILGDVINFIMGMFKPAIDAFKKIMDIFKGEGSIMSKIFRSIGTMLMAGLKAVLYQLLMAVPTLIITLLKIVLGLGKILWDLGKMIWNLLVDAVAWYIQLWSDAIDWVLDMITNPAKITAFLSDLGEWIWNEIVAFVDDIVKSIADGASTIPLIGPWIAEAMGGGSATSEEAEKLSSSLDQASETTEAMIAETKASEDYAAAAIPIPFGDGGGLVIPVAGADAAQVAQMSSAASTAKMQAEGAAGAGVAISAPTTVVGGGGGGGDSVVLSPSLSRNNDPTFRALLFLEQPAL